MIAKIALGVVAPARSGMASGINNTFRIGGVATGVAALGAIFQQRVTTSLASNLGHPAPQLAKVVASAGVRAAVAAGSSTPGHRGRGSRRVSVRPPADPGDRRRGRGRRRDRWRCARARP